jgi:hypothetical protein
MINPINPTGIRIQAIRDKIGYKVSKGLLLVIPMNVTQMLYKCYANVTQIDYILIVTFM